MPFQRLQITQFSGEIERPGRAGDVVPVQKRALPSPFATVVNPASYTKLNFFFNRDVDDVHDMMDDINEQHEIANEIANAISSPVGFGQDIDEVTFLSINILEENCENTNQSNMVNS